MIIINTEFPRKSRKKNKKVYKVTIKDTVTPNLYAILKPKTWAEKVGIEEITTKDTKTTTYIYL